MEKVKKSYIAPKISVSEIMIENSIVNSSISMIKTYDEDTFLQDEWLLDTDDEKLIEWYND